MQVDSIWILLAELSKFLDDTRVASETFASGCVFRSARAAVLVALIETAVDVIGV